MLGAWLACCLGVANNVLELAVQHCRLLARVRACPLALLEFRVINACGSVSIRTTVDNVRSSFAPGSNKGGALKTCGAGCASRSVARICEVGSCSFGCMVLGTHGRAALWCNSPSGGHSNVESFGHVFAVIEQTQNAQVLPQGHADVVFEKGDAQ